MARKEFHPLIANNPEAERDLYGSLIMRLAMNIKRDFSLDLKREAYGQEILSMHIKSMLPNQPDTLYIRETLQQQDVVYSMVHTAAHGMLGHWNREFSTIIEFTKTPGGYATVDGTINEKRQIQHKEADKVTGMLFTADDKTWEQLENYLNSKFPTDPQRVASSMTKARMINAILRDERYKPIAETFKMSN